jgi:hypothetical protein
MQDMEYSMQIRNQLTLRLPFSSILFMYRLKSNHSVLSLSSPPATPCPPSPHLKHVPGGLGDESGSSAASPLACFMSSPPSPPKPSVGSPSAVDLTSSPSAHASPKSPVGLPTPLGTSSSIVPPLNPNVAPFSLALSSGCVGEELSDWLLFNPSSSKGRSPPIGRSSFASQLASYADVI